MSAFHPLIIKVIGRFVGIVAWLAVLNGAEAATTTATFTVQINVTSSCAINSTATLDFGSQAIFSSATTGQTTLQVQCTSGMPYTIGLDQGTGPGATVGNRLMQNGGNTVSYSLYQDSNYTTVWGTTIGTDTVSFTGTGSNDAFTIYGRVPPQATPVAGM